ncbi:MAG: PEGA domain-containing protein [Myxococcota bacterium]
MSSQSRVVVALAAVVASLVGSIGQGARAAPRPKLEEIPAGPDASYLIDRARGLCFFQSGPAITPVDCAAVDPSMRPNRPTAPRPAASPDAPPAEKPHAFGRGATLDLQATPWAKVTVDGFPAGATPATLAIAPGEHEVLLGKTGVQLRSKLRLRAGETWLVIGDFSAEPAFVYTNRTTPPRSAKELGKGARAVLLAWPAARFEIDGAPVGVSPLVVELGPGLHRVRADNGTGQGATYIDVGAGDELRIDGRNLPIEDDGSPLEVVRLTPAP